MGVRIEVTVQSMFAQAAEQLPQNLILGENLAGERLLAVSVEEAPLDLGTLIGTGTVEPASTPEEGAAVVFDTPYAARLHEHPEYEFQNGRKGKYVEDPAMQHKDELGEIIAKQVSSG